MKTILFIFTVKQFKRYKKKQKTKLELEHGIQKIVGVKKYYKNWIKNIWWR